MNLILNKPYLMKNYTTSQILKVAIKLTLAVATLTIAYLFALNGRYEKIELAYHFSGKKYAGKCFDKWTKTTLILEREKVIE